MKRKILVWRDDIDETLPQQDETPNPEPVIEPEVRGSGNRLLRKPRPATVAAPPDAERKTSEQPVFDASSTSTDKRKVDRQARKEASQQLARDLKVPLSVAIDIHDGQYTYDEWVVRHQANIRRKAAWHREAREKKRLQEMEADRYFAGCQRLCLPMRFRLHYGVLTGTIFATTNFEFFIDDGTAIGCLDKLNILYCHRLKKFDRVTSDERVDEAIRALRQCPALKRRDRYSFPRQLANEAHSQMRPVKLTFIDGSVLCGKLEWLTRYSLKLRLPSQAAVVVFIHGLQDFRVAED